MHILLDDHPYQSTLADSATVDALLDELRPAVERATRMIVGLSCDGTLIAEDDIETVLQQPLSTWQEVAVATADKRALVNQALAAACELLQSTRALQEEASAALGEDRHADALAVLGTCITAWGRAHRCVVQSITVLGMDLAELDAGDDPPVAVLQDVAHNLTEIKSCLEHRDYVLLNDVLQYEMLPMFERWERLLDRLLAVTTGSALNETAHENGPPDTSRGS